MYTYILFAVVIAFVFCRIRAIYSIGPFFGSLRHIRAVKRSGYQLVFAGMVLPFIVADDGIFPVVYGFVEPSVSYAFSPMRVLSEYQTWIATLALAGAGIFTFGDESRLQSLQKRRKALVEAKSYLEGFIHEDNANLTFEGQTVWTSATLKPETSMIVDSIGPFLKGPETLSKEVQAEISIAAIKEIGSFTNSKALADPIGILKDETLNTTISITWPDGDTFPETRKCIDALQDEISKIDKLH